MLILCRYWVILVFFSNSHSPRSSFQAQLHRNPTVLTTCTTLHTCACPPPTCTLYPGQLYTVHVHVLVHSTCGTYTTYIHVYPNIFLKEGTFVKITRYSCAHTIMYTYMYVHVVPYCICMYVCSTSTSSTWVPY